MSDIVERVARAICVARGKKPDDPRWVRYPGPIYEGKAWHAHEDDARVAIAILAQEPAQNLPIDEKD